MGTQTFIPRDYDVFAGLDVDKKSISVTFTDHQGLLKSTRMPYSVSCWTVWSLARSKSLRPPARFAVFVRTTRNCLSVSSI